MARINIPPAEGSISVNAGDELTIYAASACTFSCSIGANFSPSLANASLAAGDNGPYQANRAGSGTYSTAPSGPHVLVGKSVQISG